MAVVKQGDTVRINFVGSLEDGTVFDSTFESDGCESDDCASGDCDTDECGCGEHEAGPMELTIGGGDFFPQIEEALVGMAIGEKKQVTIPAVEAFGEYDAEKVFTVPRSDLPEGMDPEVGNEYVLTNDDEEDFGVTVTEVTAESVSFDANHPLAGEDLTFEVELVEIL
jgi:peptidylprolyl isomerase